MYIAKVVDITDNQRKSMGHIEFLKTPSSTDVIEFDDGIYTINAIIHSTKQAIFTVYVSMLCDKEQFLASLS